MFRSVIENKGFYSLEKPGDFVTLVDMRYLSAMIHPGGGRNDIPERLKRHFFVLNNTIPNDEAIDKIFATIVNGETDWNIQSFLTNKFYILILIPRTFQQQPRLF